MGRPSPFTKDQMVQITLWWGEYQNVFKVRWKFAKHYGLDHRPRELPSFKAFKTVIDRFSKTGSVLPIKSPGQQKTERTEENIQRVKQLITENKALSVRAIANQLDLSVKTAWQILRKDLKFYPFKSKTVNHLDDDHKKARVKFCEWLLEQDQDFEQYVIWSDEKNFHLASRPNKQNERYWAPAGEDPLVTDECRVVGGAKLMAWAMILGREGKVHVYWHEKGARQDQDLYLEILQQFMMPLIQDTDDYEDLWMQQDGARSHTAEKVRDWLTATFGAKVISGKMEIPWPASSPDLACPDYWLWGVCLQEIRRVKPATLEELKEIVDDFCESLDPEEIRRAVANVRKRAAACIECGGGHFEHLLKKARKDAAEE